jgi:hypothetical protein
MDELYEFYNHYGLLMRSVGMFYWIFLIFIVFRVETTIGYVKECLQKVGVVVSLITWDKSRFIVELTEEELEPLRVKWDNFERGALYKLGKGVLQFLCMYDLLISF